MLVSASICLKRTLEIPSSSARRRAVASISGEKSELISVPPGSTSSAASRPVSPVPAASSSSVSPGCGSSASIIHAETGIVDTRSWSRRDSQPSAWALQRLRLCARKSSGIATSAGTLAQVRAPDLARLGARQLGDELERLRDLEAGQPLQAVRAQGALLQLGAGAGDDQRGDRLAPERVGAGEDRRLDDVGMLGERRLDLGRRHVLPAGDDHVAPAASDDQAAVLVQ